MCHFCPVEIKNLGWGQGVMGGKREFFWFSCWFYFFASHIGSSTLVRRSNMAFAKQCLMKTWKSTIVFGIQHPDIFQSRTKQSKNQYDLHLELGKPCIPKDLSKDI